MTFSVRDPVGGTQMRATAFYPAQPPEGTTTVGPYAIDAATGAPFAAGTFPLVVFSHGTGGGRYDDYDFDTALARSGFVWSSRS